MKQKRRRQMRATLIQVAKESVFFASPGDPKGEVHVANKWAEALAMSQLLLTAIARSEVSLDLLDLPGAARSLKAAAEHTTGSFRMFPGESIVHAAVATIRSSREFFAQEDQRHAEEAKAARARQEAEDRAAANAVH